MGAGVAPAHSLENRPSLAEAARSASVEPSALTPQEAQIESVFEQARSGVVAVYDAVTLSTAASQRAFQEGNGSGVVLSNRSEGSVITTNCHVVENALSRAEKESKGSVVGREIAQVTAQCSDGSTQSGLPARILGYDRQRDIAVLLVANSDMDSACSLKPLPLAQVEPKPGALALVIGTPFSLRFFNTLTVGVVSGTDRALNTGSGYIANGVQVDAPINVGNSGGAVLNGNGELMAMSTAIVTNSGTTNSGVGFALPASLVSSVTNQILTRGTVAGPPQLGVQLASEKVGRELSAPAGALVQSVTPNSGAAEAGLRGSRRSRAGAITRGDVIVEAEGKAISDAAELNSVLETKQPGETLSIRIDRGGERLPRDVQLQASTSS